MKKQGSRKSKQQNNAGQKTPKSTNNHVQERHNRIGGHVLASSNSKKSSTTPTTATSTNTRLSDRSAKSKIGVSSSVSDWQTTRIKKETKLKFSPYAWAKILWFRNHGDTEIAGFGIADTDDLLFINDFKTIKQKASAASVKFDDEAVGEFFEDMVDAGMHPKQFARVWLHTHPGMSHNPSVTDHDTFAEAFGKCDWALMFILDTEDDALCRLKFQVSVHAEFDIPWKIDCSKPFAASNYAAWKEEYDQNVDTIHLISSYAGIGSGRFGGGGRFGFGYGTKRYVVGIGWVDRDGKVDDDIDALNAINDAEKGEFDDDEVVDDPFVVNQILLADQENSALDDQAALVDEGGLGVDELEVTDDTILLDIAAHVSAVGGNEDYEKGGFTDDGTDESNGNK